MGTRVFPEVREGSEELETPIFHAVESVSRVESLVSLESVEGIKCLVAARDGAAEGLFFCVNSNVDT